MPELDSPGGGASGGASGELVFIDSVTLNGSTAAEFTGLSTDYDIYILHCKDVVLGSDTQLALQLSTDGGTSFISTTSAYVYAQVTDGSGSADNNSTYIDLTGTADGNDAANTGIIGDVKIFQPGASGTKTAVLWSGYQWGTGGTYDIVQRDTAGYYNTDAATDAVKIGAGSSLTDLSSGTITLYGWNLPTS